MLHRTGRPMSKLTLATNAPHFLQTKYSRCVSVRSRSATPDRVSDRPKPLLPRTRAAASSSNHCFAPLRSHSSSPTHSTQRRCALRSKKAFYTIAFRCSEARCSRVLSHLFRPNPVLVYSFCPPWCRSLSLCGLPVIVVILLVLLLSIIPLHIRPLGFVDNILSSHVCVSVPSADARNRSCARG